MCNIDGDLFELPYVMLDFPCGGNFPRQNKFSFKWQFSDHKGSSYVEEVVCDETNPSSIGHVKSILVHSVLSFLETGFLKY